MLPVQEYITQTKNQNQKSILQFWDSLLTTYPSVIPYIKFKIPFYYQNTWVCYLNPIKPNGVELVFLYGQQLQNKHLLQTKGRKMVAGISFFNMEDIDDDMVQEVLSIFEQALALDSTKKKK